MSEDNICPLCGKVNPGSEWVCEDCGAQLPRHGNRNVTPVQAVSAFIQPSTSDGELSLPMEVALSIHDDLEFAELEGANLSMHGAYSRSPSSQFIILCDDSAMMRDDDAVGGSREAGFGRFALIEESTVLHVGRMARPYMGRVNNDGRFVVIDWGIATGQGAFAAFKKQGEVILRQELNANASDCGISGDGRFAACQTLHSDSSDGGKVHIFDLVEAKRISNFEPISGAQTKEYKFDTDARTVKFLYHTEKTPDALYDFAGNLLNKADFMETDWNTPLLDDLANKIAALSKLEQQKAKERKALPIFTTIKNYWRDPAFFENQAYLARLLGELYEVLERSDKAISAYEKALALDEGIGVKARVRELKSNI